MDVFVPGIFLTIIGMGVVFASLIVLMAVIVLLEKIVEAGRSKDAEEPAPTPGADDNGIVLAAAAYFLETEDPGVYVPQVHRGDDSHWARAARRSRRSLR